MKHLHRIILRDVKEKDAKKAIEIAQKMLRITEKIFRERR